MHFIVTSFHFRMQNGRKLFSIVTYFLLWFCILPQPNDAEATRAHCKEFQQISTLTNSIEMIHYFFVETRTTHIWSNDANRRGMADLPTFYQGFLSFHTRCQFTYNRTKTIKWLVNIYVAVECCRRCCPVNCSLINEINISCEYGQHFSAANAVKWKQNKKGNKKNISTSIGQLLT